MKTSITPGIIRLDVQYSESVITLSGVVYAETMTQVPIDQTVNINVIEKGGMRLLSV